MSREGIRRRPKARAGLTGGGTATLPRVEDTLTLGSRLGEQLCAGDVVVLSGPLGAGKTVLAKGIAMAMDVEGPITSRRSCWRECTGRGGRARRRWSTSTSTDCWTTTAPTC